MSGSSTLRTLVIGALAALVPAACASAPLKPVTPAAPGSSEVVLEGQVSFPEVSSSRRYGVAATINDIAVGATVALIDPSTQYTVASILTNASGVFVITLAPEALVEDKFYLLEAVKGLSNNAVGHDAARVRTIIRNTTGGWTALNATGTKKTVLINESSTALSLIATYRSLDLDPAQLARLMGKLKVGTIHGSWPDDLTETDNPITFADMAAVGGLVKSALQVNADPMDAVRYQTGSYALRPDISPPGFILGSFPSMGAEGAVLTMTGASIDSSLAVTLPPAQNATIQSYTPTQGVFVVPSGVVSGVATVSVGAQVATVSFTAVPTITGTAK